jgi:hypothetical protein
LRLQVLYQRTGIFSSLLLTSFLFYQSDFHDQVLRSASASAWLDSKIAAAGLLSIKLRSERHAAADPTPCS